MSVADDTYTDWGYMGTAHSSNMVSLYWDELQPSTIQSCMGYLKQIDQINALQKLEGEMNFIQNRKLNTNLVLSFIILLKMGHINYSSLRAQERNSNENYGFQS
jgi:hypothetical protein